MELASYADSVRLASITNNKDSNIYQLYKYPSNSIYIQKNNMAHGLNCNKIAV